METVAYLLLALAVIGALAYALYQVNLRQQRLMAELTRLERLTAEVTMNAEAVLDEVDQRIERLNQLAAAVEARVTAAPATMPAAAPEATAEPIAQPAAEPAPEPDPTPAPQDAPAPADRYGELRQAVRALADEGKEPVEIAAALGVPRGEVLLLLNLRGKRGPR